MTRTAYTIDDLKVMERPVLIAWARREIRYAEEIVTATEHPRLGVPTEEARLAFDARCSAENWLTYAKAELATAEYFAASGKVSRMADSGISGISPTFESAIWTACSNAARAIAWCRSGKEDFDAHDEEKTRQYADLTRNIGVEG